MAEVVQLVVSAVLQILLTFWVVRRDDRRLTGAANARAFPTATFWIAVVVFGPLSIPIHFARTRRNWTGLGLGLLWFFATLAALGLAGFLLEIILE
jgi:hypothetical protein